MRCLRIASWRKWFSGANFSIYSCHFLASWSSRMWAFSMGLFLINISPKSLQLTATYGLSMGGAVLLFGAILGDWVDRTTRLKAATLTMILQNLLVVTCVSVVLTLTLLLSELGDLVPWLRYLLYAVIITLSVCARLMKVARVIVVERDWIVEMCAKEEHHLAVMTSSFRRIDLVTKMLAPMVTGQIMTYAGLKIGCGFIAVWSLVSLGVEYYLIRRVYNTVPALRKIKNINSYTATEIEMTATSAVPDAAHLKTDESEIAQIEKAETDDRMETTSHSSRRRTRNCNWLRLFASFHTLYRGVRTYFSYDTMWPGLALASLYLTVLGFDGITVGYATTQGLSGSILGIMMGVGALFGILATFTYPFIVKCLGLSRTGVLALAMQVSCLSLCVISVWLPGSPFDLSYTPELEGTRNCSIDLHYNGTQRTLENLSADVTAPYITTNMTSCEDDKPQKTNPASLLSVWVMIAGIVTARFGLWTADLTIIQLFLERVVPTERGIVNGFQSSLNQMMDFVKYALVVAIPHPHQFGLLVHVSFAFICIGWTLMGVYAFRVGRKGAPKAGSSGDRQDREEDKATQEVI